MWLNELMCFVGMLFAAGCITMLYRSFAGKSLEGDLGGHT
jgi:hypothetical protein